MSTTPTTIKVETTQQASALAEINETCKALHRALTALAKDCANDVEAIEKGHRPMGLSGNRTAEVVALQAKYETVLMMSRLSGVTPEQVAQAAVPAWVNIITDQD